MKRSLIIFLLMILSFSGFSLSLPEVRKLCKEAVNNKGTAYYLYDCLKKETSESIKLGYYGVARALHAKHTYNFILKYKYFLEGKALLERALSRSPNSMELRFLRFTTQCNTPVILGYRMNIMEDKEFLISHLGTLKTSNEDIELKSMIIAYLLISEKCGPEEQTKIKTYI